MFDLFGEISNQELEELKERKQEFQKRQQKKLESLPVDRWQRSTAENRMVFCHDKTSFLIPQKALGILSKEECEQILTVAEKIPEWTTKRHSAFATTDIPIRHNTLAYLEPLVTSRLMDRLAKHYGFKPQDLMFRDIFLVKYAAEGQRGLEMHTDGCLFSITLLVSDPADFEGGGTFFESIDDVLYLEQGECAFHDARVMHSGIEITRGKRFVLVGFIDTVDTQIRHE